MKNYYYILGLKNTATTEDVKKAYRKLSLKFHPDKNDGDEFFTEHFKEIKEAYEILVDSSKRRAYDIKYNGQTNSGVNFNPVIEYFNSNKDIFKYGEEITFSWKTINANKVVLKPFGIVQPIGQKTYKIKDFKNANLTFELLAENSNIGRQIKSSLTLKNRTYLELYDHFKKIIEVETSKSHTANNQSKTNHSNKKAEKSERVIVDFKTDKGLVGIEQKNNYTHPEPGNRAFINGQPAPDGKYKFGFLWYVTIKNGKVTEVTLF